MRWARRNRRALSARQRMYGRPYVSYFPVNAFGAASFDRLSAKPKWCRRQHDNVVSGSIRPPFSSRVCPICAEHENVFPVSIIAYPPFEDRRPPYLALGRNDAHPAPSGSVRKPLQPSRLAHRTRPTTRNPQTTIIRAQTGHLIQTPF